MLVLCRFVWVIKACHFFVVPSWSSSTPVYPSKVLRAKERALTPYSFVVSNLGFTFESLKELGARQYSLSTFGAKTNHGQTQTHKTHHGLDLGEATTFPLIVYSMVGHWTNIQMAFLELGFPQLWGPITLGADLWLKWGLKQSCIFHQGISIDMSHATCTWGNWVDFWLLMVRNQIDDSTFNLSFGHNLCFRCLNGSREPILDMYVPKAFQWYKENFNPLGFDSCNHSMNIQEFTKNPTPKVKAPLGVWRFIPSHSFTFRGARACDSQVSPKSRLWQVLWVWICLWFVLTPKVLKLCTS
jgi:hypothetical protein